MDPAAQVDEPADFGTDDAATVSRWISELDLSEKDQRPWVDRCRNIVKRYKGSRQSGGEDTKRRSFELLWANTQTLAPAVYARTPTAVVSRRWKDADQTARTASEVIERGLNFQLDACDFADAMVNLRDDFLLVGRGQAWVRYVPHMAKVKGKPAEPPDGEIGEQTDDYDEVIWEECIPDHVHWEDFFTNPARTWAEVRWVARRSFLTRDELKDRFGEEKGKECPLDWKANSETGDKDKDTQFAKAAVYEIWDKTSQKVFWVCKAYTECCLDKRDDPLELKDFFPCPRPLLGSTGPDSIIPTPDYVYYESQAREIDELTRRIGLLTDALKVRGFYAAKDGQKMTDLLASESGTLIPLDSWAAFADAGGVKGLIEWFPVDMVAEVLKGCIETRQQMLQDVFQITGIADIMRGDTDPDETAAAQKIKATWGSSRVRDKQKELARFVRDLLRIMGEVIATKFSPDTLAKMTGVKLFQNPEEKQQVQQELQMQAQAAQHQAQMAQQPPQPGMGAPAPQPAPKPFQPPPQTVRMLGDPTWAEVEAMLRDNAMRTFRIEIETDSTIEPNDAEEKQSRVEFVEAVATYLEKTGPIIQLAPEMLPVMVEGLKFLVRGFRVGREMEDVIEQALDALQARASAAQGQPQPHDPAAMMKAQADQTNAQANTLKAHADLQDAQTEAFRAKAEAQLGTQQIHVEDQRAANDTQAEVGMHGADIKADLLKAQMSSVEKMYGHDIRQQHLIPPAPGAQGQ
jgi:hypothetical protein